MSKYNNLSSHILIKIAFFLAVIYLVSAFGQGPEKVSGSTWVKTKYQFQGVASGGTLIMSGIFSRNAKFFSIETQAGESAESVVARMAEYIDLNNPFAWGGFQTGQKIVTAEGGILGNMAGAYMFAGTESGLGIPEPPSSVSCSYDQDKDQIVVNWTNPPEGYDKINIMMNWHHYDSIGGGQVSGSSTSFTIGRKSYPSYPIDIDDLDVWVLGHKNGLPSNAGAMSVSGRGKVQEEIFGIPFRNGVAPNWKSWTVNGTVQNKSFDGLARSNLIAGRGRPYNPMKDASQKPFYQVIKSPLQGGTVGIWRQFLGLKPGSTYRITARLNTLQMDQNSPDWSFSLHAVYDNSDGAALSTQQLAGLAPLPNGNKGLDVGKVIRYAGKTTTLNQFVESSTEITLPNNVTSMTVWLRLTGKGSEEAAYDWIKLEDITAVK